MIESDFDPQVGEEVEMFPYDGRFEGRFVIIDKHPSVWGPLLDVKRVKDGRVVKGVETNLLDYPQEERVRRAVKRGLAELNSVPDDIQKDDYDIRSEEAFDGTPKTMVYFYLKPESKPTPEKARAWNNFFSKLEEKLEPLKDSKWDRVQFAVKEKRRALIAAS